MVNFSDSLNFSFCRMNRTCRQVSQRLRLQALEGHSAERHASHQLQQWANGMTCRLAWLNGTLIAASLHVPRRRQPGHDVFLQTLHVRSLLRQQALNPQVTHDSMLDVSKLKCHNNVSASNIAPSLCRRARNREWNMAACNQGPLQLPARPIIN